MDDPGDFRPRGLLLRASFGTDGRRRYMFYQFWNYLNVLF